MVTDTAAASRTDHLRRGLRLEYFTVGWNLVEGVVAVAAALAAGSVALLGFGIDSFVECLSGGVLIWRLLAERHGSGNAEHLHRLERRAQLLVATSLAALAVFIAGDAVQTLWRGERPDQSVVGIVVTVVSLGVMWWLAKSKREVAVRLGSRAMQADAFQTTACWWL